MPLITTIGAGAARGLGFTSGQKKYNIDFLIVAGGGGGNGVATGWTYGGGGGGGGMRKFTSQEIIGGETYTATVGDGGAGAYSSTAGAPSVTSAPGAAPGSSPFAPGTGSGSGSGAAPGATSDEASLLLSVDLNASFNFSMLPSYSSNKTFFISVLYQKSDST